MTTSQNPKPHWRPEVLFKNLGEEELEKFKVFHVELLNTNKRMNLISVTTELNADILHFYDSYVASKYIARNEPDLTEIYDFGSGNGFPGIIMGILNPNIQVHLIESDSRKAEFLKYVAGRTGLRNIRVYNKRVEEMPFTTPQVCMCRGFADLSRTLIFSRHLPKGSLVYSLKGPSWNKEVASLPHQVCSTWNTELLKEYSLPETAGSRAILYSERIK